MSNSAPALAPTFSPAGVSLLENVILLPLRIDSLGELYATRANPDQGPADWLDKYTAWVTKDSPWIRIQDPFQERPKAGKLYEHLYQQYAEFVYFHPFVQKVLYERDQKRSAMAGLWHSTLQGLEVTTRGGASWSFTVLGCELRLFSTDIAILSLHLGEASFGGTTLDQSAAPVHKTLDLLNEIRRVYPPYYAPRVKRGPWFPGDVLQCARWRYSGGSYGDLCHFETPVESIAELSESLQPRLCPLWASLLEPLQRCDQPRLRHDQREKQPTKLLYRQLGDERAFCMSFAGLHPPSLLPEATLQRFADLDAGGTPENAASWAYDREFLKSTQQDCLYQRFAHYGTHTMVSGYSFTQVLEDGDFTRSTLRYHFRHHYFFLCLLVVLQKASLLAMTERLSDLVKEYAAAPLGSDSRKDLHNRFKWISEDFAEYLAIFEFGEVSNQVQGTELFAMLRKNLRIPQLQAELVQHLEFTRDVEASNYHESIQKSQEAIQAYQEGLQRIANNWFPVGLAFGVLGVSYGWDHLSAWLKEPDAPVWSHLLLFIRDVIPAVLVLYAVLVVFRWVNKMDHKLAIWKGWR